MSFEQLVLLKLDEIQREQRAHGERLATLEERTKGSTPPKRSWLQLGGVTISGGTAGALVAALLDHWGRK